jgi:hypothetical protein
MTDKTERTYVGDLVQWELPNQAGRGEITLLTGTNYKTGAVLGKITLGAATAAAKGGGNTGNGTCTAITAAKNAVAGVYKAVVAIAGTNSATWNLYDPNGELIDQKQLSGAGATAVFANDQIHATITDGGTDFIVGDGFDITVAAGSLKYQLALDTATDGSQDAAAILLFDYDATGGDVANAVVLVPREAVIDQAFLNWNAGVTTANQKTAILAKMVAAGLKLVNAV